MKYILETKNLSRRFGDLVAVNNLSLKVRKGEVFGLLGPNGAGKTTLINMIIGLLEPTSGEVYIGGERVSNRYTEVKGSIGVVPQDIVLWPNLTTQENILLLGRMYDVPSSVAKERARELLKSLHLYDKKNTLTKNLSGGMKRRLNLAMALIHDPEIVVLDEPSPGLDPQTRLLLWDFISGIPHRGDKTVILTTHFMEEADRLSTRVGIMDKGKLLVLDEPEKLKKTLGEGDIIEIKTGASRLTGDLINTIANEDGILSVNIRNGTLHIRAYDAVSHIPHILHILDSSHVKVKDMAVKSTTLEDVFIHLTGRSLRRELYDQGEGI